MRAKPETLLFDLDGTLTDSAAGIVRCMRDTLRAMGVQPPPAETLRWCIGPSLHENVRRLLPGADQATIARAVDQYRGFYDDGGYLENEVYDGVHEMLAALGSDYRLIVATAKFSDIAERVLEAFALREHFAAVFGSHYDGRLADKRDLIAHVIKNERLSSETTAFIGDREHDIVGARHHGVFAIGVSYGYGTIQELTDAGADLICAHPREIVRALKM